VQRVGVRARRGVELRGGVGRGEPAGVRRGGELVRSAEGLAVRSERAVYEAGVGWVRHDVGSRKV
jgi:hypothetical protein